MKASLTRVGQNGTWSTLNEPSGRKITLMLNDDSTCRILIQKAGSQVLKDVNIERDGLAVVRESGHQGERYYAPDGTELEYEVYMVHLWGACDKGKSII